MVDCVSGPRRRPARVGKRVAGEPVGPKSILSLLFGAAERTSLRERVYLATCLITSVVFGAACVHNASLGLGEEIIILTGVSAVAMLAFYALGRRTLGRRLRPVPALFILYLNAFGGYFGNGGSIGGVQFFWTAAVTISVFLVHTRLARAAVMSAYVAGALAVLALEYLHPTLSVPYASVEARYLDIAFSYPVAMLASAGVIQQVAFAYDQNTALLERAHARADALLDALLPKRAARFLQESTGQGGENTRIFAEDVAEATVLFADMAGFSRRAREAPSERVVRDLDRIFRRLDEIARRNGIQKIKTIGDAYMAVAGLDAGGGASARSATAAADAALDFMAAAGELEFLGSPVRFRVGLATGPVTAGVIGSERPHYDIWGDTVNLAARMEAYGEPGRIRACPATAARLAATHRLEEGPVLRLAERPETPTSWVVGRAVGPAGG